MRYARLCLQMCKGVCAHVRLSIYLKNGNVEACLCVLWLFPLSSRILHAFSPPPLKFRLSGAVSRTDFLPRNTGTSSAGLALLPITGVTLFSRTITTHFPNKRCKRKSGGKGKPREILNKNPCYENITRIIIPRPSIRAV